MRISCEYCVSSGNRTYYHRFNDRIHNKLIKHSNTHRICHHVTVLHRTGSKRLLSENTTLSNSLMKFTVQWFLNYSLLVMICNLETNTLVEAGVYDFRSVTLAARDRIPSSYIRCTDGLYATLAIYLHYKECEK